MKFLNIIQIFIEIPSFSYALCGSSGCGKTTLLKSILGHLPLESGEISIFGHNIKDKEANNIKVGFMPQEISLYGDFTIEDTAKFFGMIYGVDGVSIRQNMVNLMKVLELPNEKR